MDYTEIKTEEQLAELLRIGFKTLIKLITHKFKIDVYQPPIPIAEDHQIANSNHSSICDIKQIKIPKKNRNYGFRIVYKVENQALCDIHKKIQKLLNENYNPPIYIQGFVSKRNIKTNAEFHLAKKIILSLDIENFFETIPYSKIKSVFRSLNFNEHISKILTKLTTINKKLVQGFHASPIIANMAVSELDNALYKYCINNSYTYTRYADDITISSNNKVPDFNEINRLIKKNKFIVNTTKSKYMKRGKSQYVTGLTVFDNNKPRIPKRIKRRFRLMLYFINKYGLRNFCMHELKITDDDINKNENLNIKIYDLSHKYRVYIQGWIYFMYSIEPEVAERFKIIYLKSVKNHL